MTSLKSDLAKDASTPWTKLTKAITRKIAIDLGLKPCAPPKSNRKEPWEHDQELCKKRNRSKVSFKESSGIGAYKRAI